MCDCSNAFKIPQNKIKIFFSIIERVLEKTNLLQPKE